MSRQTWMDRTIEAARDTDVQMPWMRRRPAPALMPARDTLGQATERSA